MRVLLTGATGSLGPTLEQNLRVAGYEVQRLLRDARFAGPGDTVADLLDLDALVRACSDVEVVVHAAAQTRGAQGMEYRRVNTDGTAALAGAARSAGVRHLVLLSTRAAIAGAGGYAESKLAAEQVARSLGPAVTILRPAEVWGGARPGAIEGLASLVRRGLLPKLRGQRQPTLAPLHADDLAAAVSAVVAHGVGPEPLVLDGPECFGWNDLIERLRHDLGGTFPRNHTTIRFPVLMLRLAAKMPIGTERLRRLIAPRPADDGSAWLRLGIAPRPLDATISKGLQ